MTDATARIKNLSIALEALSKADYNATADRIFALLQREIIKCEEEEAQPSPARPAATTPDDDLPF